MIFIGYKGTFFCGIMQIFAVFILAILDCLTARLSILIIKEKTNSLRKSVTYDISAETNKN